jgi:ABC-type multidrug transport system ATPase subunit
MDLNIGTSEGTAGLDAALSSASSTDDAGSTTSRKFGTMLMAMLRKNILVKRRDKYFVMREILAPMYFVGILVLSTIFLKNKTTEPVLVATTYPFGGPGASAYPLTRGAATGGTFKTVMGLQKMAGPDVPNPYYANPPGGYKRFQDKQDADLMIGVAPCSDRPGDEVANVTALAEAAFQSNFTFRCFADASELQSAALKKPELFLAGITFETSSPGTLTFPVTYTLHVNASDMRGVGKDSFSSFQSVGPYDATWSWLSSGFSIFQRLFEQAVVQHKGGADVYFDPTIQEVPWSTYTTNMKAQQISSLIGIYLILIFAFVLRGNLAQIVEDKKKKIRIGLKMIGLTDGVYWVSWAVTMMMTYAILGVAVAIILNVGQVLPNTNIGILIVFFLIFSLDLAFLCIAMSAFFQNPEVAGIGSMVLFILMEVPGDVLAASPDASSTLKNFLALLPPTAFTLGLKTINESEIGGQGTQWNNIADASFTSLNYPVSQAMLMMLLDIPLYAFLAWYLNNVVPQEWGVPLPWYYPLQRSYWSTGAATAFDSTTALPPLRAGQRRRESSELTQQALDVEPMPESMAHKIGVSITELRKEFPAKSRGDKDVTAVSSLSLCAYEDQVFCLLGHNGAGKSTTVSMLTGLYPPTSGDATLYGHSIVSSLGDVQRMIGVCPQHDILFPSLTVREHLQLYGAIMGADPAKLPELIVHYVDAVGLSPKIDEPSSSLSGGMKRKLSVTIAFIGNPRVAFLDEPTTGMDPSSRRRIWTLLENEKEGRATILTTHYMDEADLLGDRIAIMNKGKLRVLGSSLFLKSRFGIGYTLTVSTSTNASSSSAQSNSAAADSLLKFIRGYVQSAELVSQAGTEMNFTLPLSASSDFAPLFGQLEERKAQLSVQEYGVSVTSLEEVFLRLAGESEEEDKHAKATPSTPRTSAFASASTVHLGRHSSERNSRLGFGELTTGDEDEADEAWSLVDPSQLQPSMLRQVKALLTKRILYAQRSRKYAMMQVLMPIVYVMAGILIVKFTAGNSQWDVSTNKITLDPSLFTGQKNGNSENQYLTFLPQTIASSPSYADATYADLTATAAVVNGFNVQQDCCAERGLNRFSDLVAGCAADVTQWGQRLLPAETASAWCNASAAVLASGSQLPKYNFAVGAVDLNSNGGEQPGLPFQPAPPYLSPGYAGYRLMINSTVLNSIPILSSLVHSALARVKYPALDGLPADGAPLFKPGYQPWPKVPGEKDPAALIQGLVGGLQLAIWTTIALSYMPGIIVFFVTMEKEKKIAHQQRVMGVSAKAYHLSNYAFDCCAFIPALIAITSLLAVLAVDSIKSNAIGVFLMLLCYLPAAAPWAYVISRNFTKAIEAQSACLGICILFGMISTIAYFFMLILYSVAPPGDEADQWEQRSEMVGYIASLLLPPFCVGSGLINLSFFFNKDIGFSKLPPLFDWKRGLGRSIVFLLLDAVLYWALLLYLEHRDEKVATTGYDGGLESHAADVGLSVDSPPSGEDSDVQAERRRLAAQRQQATPDDNISVWGLRKVYPPRKVADSGDDDGATDEPGDTEEEGPSSSSSGRCCSKGKKNHAKGAHEAVKDMYLGIKSGECFGLLGVNGAGKTTTLSMLTGDVRPTSGTASLGGFDVSTELPKVLGKVGYCPQFDAQLEELTGLELLRIFAALKGVPETSLEAVVQSLIKKVGLTPHAQSPTKGYSGGNKRKLSLAMALVGSPSLVFLDEPSSGMDPFSRREMWKVIQTTAAKLGASVILTTHFMEEADALCGRIGIMVDGRLACIGSSQHLKSTYGAGYQVELRLGEASTDGQARLREFAGSLCPAGSAGSAVEAGGAKNDDAEYIGAVKVLEHHAGQLRCELPSSGLSLASVFAKIEAAKPELGIEDYAVSQTSLEQVFLQFANRPKTKTSSAIRTQSQRDHHIDMPSEVRTLPTVSISEF